MTLKHDEKIKFSIILPVYNVEDYVADAIESVLRQTYSNIELIIVNDGSTDKSKNIIDEYAKLDPRIKVIDCPNNGLSEARNIGLRNASGEYIFFMDSDDIIDKNLFEIVNGKTITEKQKVFMVGFEEFSQSNTFFGKEIDQGVYENKSIIHNILTKKMENYVWQFIIEKSILSEKLRFKTGVLFEDIDWTARFLSQVESVYYINKSLYKYRVRLNSITHTRSLKKANDLLIVLELLEKTIKENFPSELKNFNNWRKTLDLTVYFDFSILGWESKKIKRDLFFRIAAYDYSNLDLKQMLKLALIKHRIVYIISKLMVQ